MEFIECYKIFKIKEKLYKLGYNSKEIFHTKLFEYIIIQKKDDLIKINSGHYIFEKIMFSMMNIYNQIDNYHNIYNLSQDDDIIKILQNDKRIIF